MSERRFYLRELADYEYQNLVKEQYTITESELKRRLTKIVAKTRLKYQDRTILIEDAVIDILLQGTEKVEAVPQKNDTDATGQTIGYVKAVHAKPAPGLFHGPGLPSKGGDVK